MYSCEWRAQLDPAEEEQADQRIKGSESQLQTWPKCFLVFVRLPHGEPRDGSSTKQPLRDW